MYNRYVRSDDGRYERIPAPAPPREAPVSSPPPEGNAPPRPDAPAAGGGRPPEPENPGVLDRILGRLNLQNIDTGDLLLLAILFLLFRDGGDEELLIALGLLLIL